MKPGSKVTVYVSNGQQISMPPLTGLSPTDAKRQLQQLGWNGQLVEQKESTSDSKLDGKVMRSSPSGGDKISKNQTITIYVGEYDSSPTTQPDDGFFPPFP